MGKIKYERKYNYNLSDYLNYQEHKEIIKDKVFSAIARDLTEWFVENDFIHIKYTNKCEYSEFGNEKFLYRKHDVEAEIEFELKEIPRKYKRQILIEINK